MIEFHRIWIDQCAAAERIRDHFGLEKSLGYLIGEKLVMFLKAADARPEFAREVPAFVAEIRRIYERDQIRDFLGRIRRVGPLAHIGSEEEVRAMRESGMFGEEDPVEDAEDLLLVERIREMLLP